MITSSNSLLKRERGAQSLLRCSTSHHRRSRAALVSPVYVPNFFPFGFLFGIPAGLFEEIGWTGFALPRMAIGGDALGSSLLLGVAWSCWHLPVVNYLGSASPHGDYWAAYSLVFALAMTAMRVLICWLYVNSKSLMLAQLMHMSSTGSLVVFSASRASAAQEALWYGIYGLLLWGCVAVVMKAYGRSLKPADAICDQHGSEIAPVR